MMVAKTVTLDIESVSKIRTLIEKEEVKNFSEFVQIAIVNELESWE